VKLAQGSTRYNMSKNEFLKLKINLPTESEQIKISNILASLSEKLETEKRILALLEQQKKYFLQNLFI
jgi:type I restriction enzyme S subunit